MSEKEQAILEIYLLFKNHRGSFNSVSGFLGRDDASKISRQINPSDERRDNPFLEILEIQEALASFSPELEEKVWRILERERNKVSKSSPTRTVELNELIHDIFPELGDVVFCSNRNAPQEELEREVFEFYKAAEKLYEHVKTNGKN